MFSDSIISRYWKYVRKENGCWKWTGAKVQGYGVVSKARAHRVSWFIHYGTFPTELFVCHHCDNPECTNPEHLFLGTPKDNVTDAYNKGRIDNYVHASGEKNNAATLTNSDVLAIRKDYNNGMTLADLETKYQHSNIIRIVRNKCYYDPKYTPINGNKKPRPFRKKIKGQDLEKIKSSNLSSRKLAKAFNVSKTTILQIKKGEY